MRKITVNFGPFGVYLWGPILLVSGLAIGGGALLSQNPTSGTIYTQQLANGQAKAGQFVRAGACTDTSYGTSAGTASSQCWSTIRAEEVQDLVPIPPGLPGQAVCYTGTGTSTTTSKAPCGFSTFTGGTVLAGSNVVLSTGTNTTTGTSADLGSSPRIHAVGLEPTLPAGTPGMVVCYAGTGTSVTTSKTACAQTGGLPSGGAVGEHVAVTSVTATRTMVITGTQTSIGTQTYEYTQTVIATNTGTNTKTGATGTYTFTATGTPTGARTGTRTTTGTQTGTYTFTSTGTGTANGTQTVGQTGTLTSNVTGTGTTTSTEWKTTPPPFDPTGIYFLTSAPSEGSDPGPGPANSGRWQRWRVLRGSGSIQYLTYAGTCSSGNDALIMEMASCGTYNAYPAVIEQREVWPEGPWLADIRAKVNANGAAIRVEAYEDTGYGERQWFNFTTNSFSNTSFAQVKKLAVMPGWTPVWSSSKVKFRLYATCSTSTTVTIEVSMSENGFSSRIYSPFTVDRIEAWDVPYADTTVHAKLFAIENWQVGIEQDLTGLEPALPPAAPGKLVGYIGTGTSVTTYKGPVDGVSFGTSTPASVGTSGSVGTSTQASRSDHVHAGASKYTTRKFLIPASAFTAGSGATECNVISTLGCWTLRDGNNDSIVTAFHLPDEMASSSVMYFSIVWSPSATDGTSSHRPAYSIGYMPMSTGAVSLSGPSFWSGDACGSNCKAGYLVNETSTGSFTAYKTYGDYAITIMRDHASTFDTYVGDVRVVAVKVSYTSVQ